LIGATARITVDTPPGELGEALVHAETLIKYPVRALDETTTLRKGDQVRVVQVTNGRLIVTRIT
jgi:membrane-bound ClpP family serine protease